MDNSFIVLGMMSGTSLDGLDMACCRLVESNGQWQHELIAAESRSYTEDWHQKLKVAIHSNIDEIDPLHQEYGIWLGEQAKQFLAKHDLAVDFIASHGHTVFHQPEEGVTVQIGSGQQISNITRKQVVCDFRSRDVSLGGQGAPLVPIGDELLFAEYSACINMGGIANISFRHDSERVAFDVGMANMLLNYLTIQIGKPYDDSGLIARSGKVDSDLLKELNDLEYHKLPYPKSTGYEWFLSDVQKVIDRSQISVIDKLATSVEHEAMQIGLVMEQYVSEPGEVIVTGGGALNAYFIERLGSFTPSHLKIVVPDKELIEFKEAIVFAFMGVLRLRNEVNCLKSVTGATQDSSGGELFEPQN
jgi:anhydro-N-acetylmuramic acid kinase